MDSIDHAERLRAASVLLGVQQDLLAANVVNVSAASDNITMAAAENLKTSV